MNWLKRLLLHSICWLFFIAIFLFVSTNGFKASQGFVIHFIGMSLLNVAIFYINLYFIIPLTLNKHRFLSWILSILMAIVVFAFVKYGFSFYLFYVKQLLNTINDRKVEIPGFLVYTGVNIFINGFFVFLSTVLKFTADWFINEKEKSELERQRLSAELAFLKSQINPHFLFNSLNNIYSLAYQKSASTPDAILKLSEIMRYMLYESNDEKVLLKKELTYLQSYIDLQKLRFGDKAYIDFKIEGQITTQLIVPLLLISFVENAFKHGLATSKETPIYIGASVYENKLLFVVKNKKNKLNKDQTGGIGMANVKRRLDLGYPDNYKLSIEEDADNYNCELFIDL